MSGFVSMVSLSILLAGSPSPSPSPSPAPALASQPSQPAILTVVTLLLVIGAVVFAALVVVRGELMFERLPRVQRFRALRAKWEALAIDLEKLARVSALWELQARQDGEVDKYPITLRRFCKLEFAELIRGKELDRLPREDGRRSISDAVHVVAYPVERLSRLTHELRLYAGFVVALFAIKVFRLVGEVSRASPPWDEAVRQVLTEIGGHPLHFFDWLKVALLSVFAARLVSELTHLQEYTGKPGYAGKAGYTGRPGYTEG